MKNFTIDNNTNSITIHSTAKEAEGVPNSERFGTEAALAKLAANWPAARLVEIWNSLPGETAVRRFKDRATAVSRIWRGIQSLSPTEATPESAPAADGCSAPDLLAERTVAPAEQPAAETAQPRTADATTAEPAPDTTVAQQGADVAPEAPAATKKAARAKKASVAAPAKEAGAPREGGKTAQVIAMLKRDGGTTLEEIMSTMGWLKHTTRAMLSAGGSIAKKHRLTVISEKVGETRRYYIKG